MYILNFSALTFFLLLSFFFDANKATFTNDNTNIMTNTGIINFKGKLLSIPSEIPKCGDQAFAGTYKFGVIEIFKGEKIKNKIILITVPCPDFKGEAFFIKGKTYKIEANFDFVKSHDYSVQNDYGNKYLNLWCEKIEKLF